VARTGAPFSRSVLTVDNPGVLVVDARPAGENAVWLHLREIDGQPATLSSVNVSAWRPIAQADEVNVLGEVVRSGIDTLDLKPFEVKFVRLQLSQ
jgi:hypothetical protein